MFNRFLLIYLTKLLSFSYLICAIFYTKFKTSSLGLRYTCTLSIIIKCVQFQSTTSVSSPHALYVLFRFLDILVCSFLSTTQWYNPIIYGRFFKVCFYFIIFCSS